MGILSCLAPGQSRELGALERVTITVLGVACTRDDAADRPRRGGGAEPGDVPVPRRDDDDRLPDHDGRRVSAARPVVVCVGPFRADLGVVPYFIAMHSQHELRWPMVSPLSAYDIAAAVVLILLVLEATRRTIGMTLVTMVGLFLAYALWGHHLEGSFSHRPLTFTENLDHLIFTTNGLLGPAMAVATFLVFIFVIFGAVLERMGGGDFFFDLSTALVGQQVGGPAKVAVISSGLYGTISGSPTADVVTTGTFTIPVMTRLGYSRRLCGRHRGRRLDRRIDHAAGDGHGRVPDGRFHRTSTTPTSPRRRSSPGCSTTRPVRRHALPREARQSRIVLEGPDQAARRRAARQLVLLRADRGAGVVRLLGRPADLRRRVRDPCDRGDRRACACAFRRASSRC